MVRARRVDGAFLRAADPQALAHWYAENLGVTARSREGGVELQGPPGQTWDVSVEVEDLDAVVAQLRAAGAEVRDDADGVLFHDPAGHVVRLHRPADAQYVRAVDEPPEEPERPARRKVSARALALALAAVVAVVLAVVVSQQGSGVDPTSDDPPRGKITAELSAGPTSSADRAPVVTERKKLPISGDWELFVYHSGELLRVELDSGRSTSTVVPRFERQAPVSLVTGPHGVVVQSYDSATGYLIADGKPAAELAPAMARADPALPGPKPGQLWLPINRAGSVRLAPVDFDGTRTGPPVWLPSGFWAHSADGRGGIVVGGVGGEYLADRDGLRRVSTGQMLAIGPKTFLVQECGQAADCGTVVIDRDNGGRRTLRTEFERGNVYQPGVISPDGRTAAITRSDDTGGSLMLLDLRSGRTRTVYGVAPTLGEAAPVWSPDGKWLIAVSADGVQAVDPDSGELRSLGLGLVSADAVAIRR